MGSTQTESVDIMFGTEHPNQAHLLHLPCPAFPVMLASGVPAQLAGCLHLVTYLSLPTPDLFYLSNIF